MVDETTTPLSAPKLDLPAARPDRFLDSTGGSASDGVSQTITAIALYPLLQVFRLLSKLASRSLVAADTEHRSNPFVQDTVRPQNQPHVSTDGPNAVAKRPSPGVRAADFAKESNATPAKGQISIDPSFDGVDPASPSLFGKQPKGRGRVT